MTVGNHRTVIGLRLGTIPVAQVIRELRLRIRLTQRQLGHRTGFRQAQISSWEHGRKTPGSGSLIQLADALGHDLILVARRTIESEA